MGVSPPVVQAPRPMRLSQQVTNGEFQHDTPNVQPNFGRQIPASLQRALYSRNGSFSEDPSTDAANATFAPNAHNQKRKETSAKGIQLDALLSCFAEPDEDIFSDE